MAEQRPELVQARGSSKEDGKDHVPNLMNLETCALTRRETSEGASKQKPEILHENGIAIGLVRKQGEKPFPVKQLWTNQKASLG